MVDRIRGNIDRLRIDPASGKGRLCGWVTDTANASDRNLVVRCIEDGIVIGEVVANMMRDDGFHGFEVPCEGGSLASRTLCGGITAIAHAADGFEAPLRWHPPFLAQLRNSSGADDRVTPGMVAAVRHLPNGIELTAGRVHLRIVAVRNDIIRVRMATGANWTEDVSWAVQDPARHASTDVRALAEHDCVGFATAALTVRVVRNNGQLRVSDTAGEPVSLDAEAWAAEWQNGAFAVHKQRLPNERYFGLGDQPGPLDRSEQAFVLWNTDAAWYQESSGPLYKSIPFFIAARPTGCCGILLDNTWRSRFDFGRNRRGIVSFGADGGPVDYYILHGADAAAVLQSYAHLTGLPPLPPLWALGYQQSRFSYMTEAAVLDVADGLRRRNFPADVIYCDIDYQDRYRPFTVDPVAFPDFPGMVGSLAARGFRTVVITDLHIARVDEGYAPYQSGMAGDHFIRDANGDPYIGTSWPGEALFPDFTRAETRNWWGSLHVEFVAHGVGGLWNDMNEPSVASEPTGTMPLDAVHRIDEPGYPPRSASHAELHNVLGMQNLRATYEALLELRPNERPFVLTRASFAGGQRYGWTWTGDNSATWNHLRMATPMLVNAGLSGMAFTGADVGGFFGSVAPALLTKWFQVGAFQPLFRNHCFKESAPREPWVDGPEHEAIRRRFVEERYRLLPYIYTVAEEASRTGLPMMRPLFLEFPSVLTVAGWFNREPNGQFMLGAALMIAPAPFGDMLNPFVVTLPEGPWYDYWTGHRVDAPAVAVLPRLETLPVFAHGGCIVPRQPLVQSTMEPPDGPLELLIYPGADCAGSIYLDDGHSLEFRDGAFLRQRFAYSEALDTLQFRLSRREGTYTPWWRTIELVIHGLDDRPRHVACDRATVLDVSYDHDRRAVRLLMSDTGDEAVVTITGPA
jgi:alpha-glucosidase